MSHALKNLIMTIAFIVVMGLVYYYTIGNSAESPSAIQSSSTITQETEKILANTKRIKEFTIDDSVLKDQRFRSLKDMRVVLTDIETGRNNPFSPIE